VIVGIIVDGQGEVQALPLLLVRIGSPHTILQPVLSDVQPLAPLAQIALRVAKRVRLLHAKGAERIVLLLDRESRNGCPGALASALSVLIADRAGLPADVILVVIKDRTFENWLIADPDALRSCSGLFEPSHRFERHIAPDRADHVEALGLLKAWTAKGQSYHKIKAACAICSRLAPLTAAANSRSFRRFLRTIDVPPYTEQSRLPAQPGQ